MLQDLIARCDILETTIPFGVCTFWSFLSLEYRIPIMCPEWKKWMVIETAMKKVCNRLYVDIKIPEVLHYVKLHYSRFKHHEITYSRLIWKIIVSPVLFTTTNNNATKKPFFLFASHFYLYTKSYLLRRVFLWDVDAISNLPYKWWNRMLEVSFWDYSFKQTLRKTKFVSGNPLIIFSSYLHP